MPEEHPKWEGAIVVPLEAVEPNVWNPNVMFDETFNLLCEEIQKVGFDEPIQVVRLPGDRFRIINGEHRWRGAKVLGMKEIPVVVQEVSEEDQQKMMTVRRNLIKGELDKKKFTVLADEMLGRFDPEFLKLEFGMTDDLWKRYYVEVRERDEELDAITAEVGRELVTIDNLSLVLNQLFRKYGHTVPYHFMFLMWGKKLHVMVQMDKQLRDAVERIMALAVKEEVDVNALLSAVIDRGSQEVEVVEGAERVEWTEEGGRDSEEGTVNEGGV